MKNLMKKLFATLLILCLTFSIVACDFKTNTEDENTESEYAYLSIDINPSIELVIKDEVVTSVKACNDDAVVLLTDETLEGLTVEEASKKIVELAEKMGYLTDENQDVKISVAADSAGIVEKIEAEAKLGTEKGSKIAKFQKTDRAEDVQKVKELQEKNEELYKELNPAKLRLIEAIMEYDETITYEEAASMEIKELVDILDEYIEEYKDFMSKELKDKYKQNCDAIKEQAKKDIAEIYGEEYSKAFEKHEQLKEAYKILEEKAEIAELTEEDIAQIATILGVEDIKSLFPEGEINAEVIENYLNEILDGDEFKEIKTLIENIIDKYKDAKYELSDEEISQFEEMLGEKININNLDDLKEIIEANENSINEIKEKIELTEEQKASIEEIKTNIELSKEELKDEMQNEIKDMKEDFRQQKEEKMSR